MIRIRIIPFAFLWVVLSVALVCAQDLSKYRNYELGMTLSKVVEQAGINVAQAKLIYERPAVIQELEWRPGTSTASASSSDSVEEILFGFYNNQLYRIVIQYNQDNTEGLTEQDLIEAISAKYGKPTMPVATVISSSSSQSYADSEKVLACWDNQEYSINLFRFAYRSTYGMLLFSKPLDILAKIAIVESMRLNVLEAPQREIERQKREDDQKLADGKKARTANKRNFHP